MTRLTLPIIVTIIAILCGCVGAESVGRPAPCGREGDTKRYASQEWECTQQGWQVVAR